ncbi:hypothetical protein HMSSN036_23450 [Paenibacillus macerans]|nr:hypothetical protein HMSSN036_23450 [Paenibacillus macerans]
MRVTGMMQNLQLLKKREKYQHGDDDRPTAAGNRAKNQQTER